MIREKQAKAFCREDISLIENYDLAIADQTNVWDCHHRNGIQFSRDELKAKGLYWKRPASELIFLTHSEHMSLHYKGKPKSAEHRAKISVTLKGRTPWNKGKTTPIETREKLSKALKGKPLSAERKTNISKRTSGKNNPRAKAVYQIDLTTGKIIKRWDYIGLAAKTLGLNGGSIGQCCKGRIKSAGGFIWRYVN